MDKVICKNTFVSDDETLRSKEFNEIWIKIINIMINK